MATKQAQTIIKRAMTAAETKAQTELDAIQSELAGTTPSLALVRATIVRVALAFVGVREVGTTNSGYWVDKFLGHLGLKPGYAWCMAFVQWVLRFVATLFGMKDFLPFNHAGTKAVYDWCEKKGYVTTDLSLVEPGDQIFWQNGKGPQGHVGIVTMRNGTLLATAEGNTSDRNWRDGGGMSKKKWVLDPDKIGVPHATERWVRGFVRLEKLYDASRAVTAA